MTKHPIHQRGTVVSAVSLCFFLLWGLSSLAQDNRLERFEPYILTSTPPLQTTDSSRQSGPWGYHIDVTTFFRDAEFSMPFTPGYTATGFFADPTVTYTIGTFGRLAMGLHLAGAAGYQGLRLWQPLLRMECTLTPDVRLIMGTLYGALSHGLYEPMLDRERYIYAHQEEGVQLLAYIRPLRWRTDTWLHWENLLEPWHMDQERFTLGSSNEINLIDTQHPTIGCQLSIPFSFLGSHRGGQFSALDTCIESLFTESIGLRLNFQLPTIHSQFTIHTPFFFYQDISPTSWQAYKNGRGFWPQISYCYEHTGWQLITAAGFWMGHQYIAPRGGYLFQSVSWDKPNFRQPERQMATLRLALERAFTPNFRLGADAQAYYDPTQRRTDIAFGLYMRLLLKQEYRKAS